MNVIRKIEIPETWSLHSYYTLCPYAPDGSGRVLVSGVDLESKVGAVFVLDKENNVLAKFGEHQVESGFYHTGFWQTWSLDARYVYYQSGSLAKPTITRYELQTGQKITISGDAEGAPPNGEPLVSGLMGMLYAAGYGYGKYNPELAPVPFEKRDEHGLFSYTFEPKSSELALSVNDVLAAHPDKNRLLEIDRELASKNGTAAGLTLMTYCVRWNPQGNKLVFYFGNHCVVKERGEPRVACLFTCNRDFSDLHLALDMSGSAGVHWSWHPDGVHLVGYGDPPDNDKKETCMAIVRYDGAGFRKLCSNYGNGHPSICPVNHNLLVTDTYSGDVIFWDIKNNKCLDKQLYPCQNEFFNPEIACQRNETRICHHPVFSRDGKAVLFNVLDGTYASLYEVEVDERFLAI